MFVQRLTSWLRRIFASLSVQPRATQPLRADDSAVMTGCAAGQRARGQDGAASVSGSWLDDGRTLRPRPAAPKTQEPRRPARGAAPRQQPPVEPAAQPRQSVPSQPVPVYPAADALPPDTTPVRAQPPQPAPPSRPLQPAALTPAPLDPQDETGTPDQALYRRLMSLKRLVRLGIYGEGFDPRNTPEQYLHSLGRDDDFDPDWDEQPGE